MEEKQVKLTYETLFEILQREKNRGELQKLDPTFFQDIKAYLQKKLELTLDNNEQSKLFGEQANLKTLHELKNIKKIIREIYEKRERKIIELSLNRSRTANLIQNPNLLPEEQLLHAELLTTFDKNRRELLHSILNPNITTTQPTTTPATHQTTEPPTQPQETATETQTTTTIRFTEPVSQFVGTELESYGPFEAEDIANLPRALADVLIKKQKAEEMSAN